MERELARSGGRDLMAGFNVTLSPDKGVSVEELSRSSWPVD